MRLIKIDRRGVARTNFQINQRRAASLQLGNELAEEFRADAQSAMILLDGKGFDLGGIGINARARAGDDSPIRLADDVNRLPVTRRVKK